MGEIRPGDSSQLLTIQELSSRSKLSVRTLRRLKDGGRLAFYQPGGKGGVLLFPADAIERASPSAECDDIVLALPAQNSSENLSGPQPAWKRTLPKEK